ncbi:hypothetical protein [Pedobacter sp. Leaf216]|uniref:hypothetical protein n=1 Tax=Pedobacter sp. Leaf216 TaxID=1735684 RepID=UPI000B0328D8|nr:hypothetical protein [Pedobacter sp. Leaf216]
MKNKRKRIENSNATQLATRVASSSSFELAAPKGKKRNGKYLPEIKEMPPIRFNRHN